MTDDQTAQILADADEIEFTFGSQYPPGSHARMAFYYAAEILRREFRMTDDEKAEPYAKDFGERRAMHESRAYRTNGF